MYTCTCIYGCWPLAAPLTLQRAELSRVPLYMVALQKTVHVVVSNGKEEAHSSEVPSESAPALLRLAPCPAGTAPAMTALPGAPGR